MGFKINYYSEAMLLLIAMFILIVPLQLNAHANTKEPIGLTEQPEFLIAPLPQVNVILLDEPKPVEEIIVPPLEKPEALIIPNTNEVMCLAEAVYFESKNEPIAGQKAVAHVIINRSNNPKYPNTVCKVINQKYKSICQFSYKCDNVSDVPKNKSDFEIAIEIAKTVLKGEKDNTAGALLYHNHTVKPVWAKLSRLTVTIGHHKFYRG